MASRAAQTQKTPVQAAMTDGSPFVCPCKSTEFRKTIDPMHLFCRCGQIYTEKDLVSPEEL